MPEYDWMSDTSFRDEVDRTVSRAASQGGMARYQTAIVDRLVQHLADNRTILLEQELIKTASARRTKNDALTSVETLVKRASVIASQDHRTLVEARDFDQAYSELFCMVWPFCGRRR